MQLVAHTLTDRDGPTVGKSRTLAKSARVA